MANIAFIGYGLILLGVFNITFFPIHFKRPDKVGVPFVIAAMIVFVLIGLGIVLRWSAPVFTDVLNTPDPQHLGAKLGVLFGGLAFYCAITVLSCYLSAKNFVKVDF